jgi:energy-coupling factor transporter ATP-binding protein EcfA2
MPVERVLEVRDASWKYATSSNYVLKEVSFSVEPGECVGIVGPTGAGKTTLLYCLNGLIPHNYPGTLEGRIMLMGVDTRNRSVPELSREVGMIFEDPEAQFVGLTVEEDVVFGLENLCFPTTEIKDRLDWALKQVNLEGFETRNAHTLSGGEKQRVAIASILAMRPKILLMDEPTSELDPIGKKEIFTTIRHLKAELGITLVIVEHEIEELVKVADRLVVLKNGSIVSSGPTRALFKNPLKLLESGVAPLDVASFFLQLSKDGFLSENDVPLTEDEAVNAIKRFQEKRI